MKTTLLVLFLVMGVAAAGFWFGYQPEPILGPVDGHELAATDIERVALDTEAPDFNLLAYSGDVLALSDYHGEKDVVLVFYRGHW